MTNRNADNHQALPGNSSNRVLVAQLCVLHGTFVMNASEVIYQAVWDFQEGRLWVDRCNSENE